jgi:hypothetical protein
MVLKYNSFTTIIVGEFVYLLNQKCAEVNLRIPSVLSVPSVPSIPDSEKVVKKVMIGSLTNFNQDVERIEAECALHEDCSNLFRHKSTATTYHDLENLKSVNLSRCDGSMVKTLKRMFDGCTAVEKISLPGGMSPDDVRFMFNNCASLKDLERGSLFNPLYAGNMFKGCQHIHYTDIHGFHFNRCLDKDKVMNGMPLSAQCINFN